MASPERAPAGRSLQKGSGVFLKLPEAGNHDREELLENLRVVDRAGNSQNKGGAQANNLSCGLLGVTWNKQHQRWQAKLMAHKVRHHVGYFDTPEEATADLRELQYWTEIANTILRLAQVAGNMVIGGKTGKAIREYTEKKMSQTPPKNSSTVTQHYDPEMNFKGVDKTVTTKW